MATAHYAAGNQLRTRAREVAVVYAPLGHRSAASHVEERLSHRTAPTRPGRSTRSLLGHRLSGGVAHLSFEQARSRASRGSVHALFRGRRVEGPDDVHHAESGATDEATELARSDPSRRWLRRLPRPQGRW